MAIGPVFDLDVLRSLVFIAEEGSFTRAAERVGRTQSAVSLQIQKLEDLVRQPLLARAKGGRVELTPQGRALLEAARAMLKLNDEAFRAVAANGLQTTVRLGTSGVYAPFYLPETLEAHRVGAPHIRLEVIEGYSCQVAPRIKDDAFDLVVCESGHGPRGWPSAEVGRRALRWIGSEAHAVQRINPLPLSLTPRDCPWRPAWMEDCYWRSEAIRALERAGRPYRVVSTSNSMEGLYAPVAAGEALTVSTDSKLPRGLRQLGEAEGLPPLPDCGVVLIKARNAVQPHTDVVAGAILSTFRND